MPGLGPSPLRVLHLTDLHLDEGRPPGRPDWLGLIDGLDPDVVAFTGDYTYTYGGDWGRAVAVVAEVCRMFPGKEVVGVRGNSDHAQVMAALGSGSRLRPLRNEGFLYQKGESRLWVGGVEDPHHKEDDPAAALAGRPEGCPSLLLAHSPDVVLIEASRQADLILTGHTHGGQVRLPFLGALMTKTRLGRRHSVGLARPFGVRVFISRGLGGLPLRFFCPTEAALIDLKDGSYSQ